MDGYVTKNFTGIDVFRNVIGGALVKWVRSPHTIEVFLWESYWLTGGEGGILGGGNRGMPKPSAPIMDINNIHTELQWKLGSRG